MLYTTCIMIEVMPKWGQGKTQELRRSAFCIELILSILKGLFDQSKETHWVNVQVSQQDDTKFTKRQERIHIVTPKPPKRDVLPFTISLARLPWCLVCQDHFLQGRGSDFMSGKAPPKGPRALLGSLPVGQASTASTSTNSQPSSSSTPTSPAKKTLPTGPRSLTNGSHIVGQTPFRSGKSKPALNGHILVGPSAASTGNAKPPPTGPSALSGRALDKGKQVERNPISFSLVLSKLL